MFVPTSDRFNVCNMRNWRGKCMNVHKNIQYAVYQAFCAFIVSLRIESLSPCIWSSKCTHTLHTCVAHTHHWYTSPVATQANTHNIHSFPSELYRPKLCVKYNNRTIARCMNDIFELSNHGLTNMITTEILSYSSFCRSHFSKFHPSNI